MPLRQQGAVTGVGDPHVFTVHEGEAIAVGVLHLDIVACFQAAAVLGKDAGTED